MKEAIIIFIILLILLMIISVFGGSIRYTPGNAAPSKLMPAVSGFYGGSAMGGSMPMPFSAENFEDPAAKPSKSKYPPGVAPPPSAKVAPPPPPAPAAAAAAAAPPPSDMHFANAAPPTAGPKHPPAESETHIAVEPFRQSGDFAAF